MKYVGLQKQISRNNFRSTLLLFLFPLVILAGVYAFLFFVVDSETENVNSLFLSALPFVIGGVLVWFLIAFAMHSSMIKMATGSSTLERKENMRVYNLVENLCISVGMAMPKLKVIESDALNAFASGINEKTFTVTLTTGIIDTLDDNELQGVIAHELTHIRNRDVRLLIISIVFVGILGFIVQILFRSLLFGGGRRRNKDSKMDGRVMLIALAVAVVVYLLSILFKFALSRKREYMADAGAVDMTKNPLAMASALRKISGNSSLEMKSSDMKQAFIDNTPLEKNAFSAITGLFATHPPITKRIEFLEQM
ncbi:MAG: M48 family metallopeptidase [Crocinitomicaceae bacterium]|nr:M48 family metallopeptidase [Crocinitomicaceae bacterium]